MSNCFLVGYGPGVGHGAALAFRDAGYQLALFGRNLQRLESQAADLGARAYQADASRPGELTAALQKAVGDMGPPEILLYNAVALRQTAPSGLTADELRSDFNTNVAGAVECVNLLLPLMKEGSFLFTGGGWALYPDPAVASTAMGKAALRHYALMLEQELRNSPVRAGTLTIMGQVAPATAFDPVAIGKALLQLHTQPRDRHEAEMQFRGSQG